MPYGKWTYGTTKGRPKKVMPKKPARKVKSAAGATKPAMKAMPKPAKVKARGIKIPKLKKSLPRPAKKAKPKKRRTLYLV